MLRQSGLRANVKLHFCYMQCLQYWTQVVSFLVVIQIIVTYSVTLNDMLGELFLAVETPEAPKQSFFKNLFGQGVTSVDREELCKLKMNFFEIDKISF